MLPEMTNVSEIIHLVCMQNVPQKEYFSSRDMHANI